MPQLEILFSSVYFAAHGCACVNIQAVNLYTKHSLLYCQYSFSYCFTGKEILNLFIGTRNVTSYLRDVSSHLYTPSDNVIKVPFPKTG